MTLKQVSFCSFLPDMLFAKFWRGNRFIKILKKPKAIVQVFFLGSEKMC